MLSAGLSARSQNTFWHQSSDWRCCCTCQCHFPQAVFVLWVRCHIQRVHTAVTLFLLICSPVDSNEERCVWQAARAGLILVCQRADPSLACTLPLAPCWRGRQRGKEAAWRSCWPCSLALQPDPVPLHFSSLPALLVMSHRKDVSQAAIPFQGVPQLLCLGLGQEDRQQQCVGVKRILLICFMCRMVHGLGFKPSSQDEFTCREKLPEKMVRRTGI